jgi:hypothetical protein
MNNFYDTTLTHFEVTRFTKFFENLINNGSPEEPIHAYLCFEFNELLLIPVKITLHRAPFDPVNFRQMYSLFTSFPDYSCVPTVHVVRIGM